jgi:hypothetical protein
MAMHLLPFVSARARSTRIAAGVFCASVATFALIARNEPAVAASGNQNLDGDLDRDGLSDVYELIMGTQPNRVDTDGDGYSDLEEFARGSDPTLAHVVPEPSEYSLGFGACQSGGMVTMLASIYADASKVGSLELEFALVHQGRLIRFHPSNFRPARAFRMGGHDAGDRLTVVELSIPVALVRRVGQINVVSILRDPASPYAQPHVGILPLVDFSGTIVSVERLPAMLNATGGRPAGIIYRPLAGDSQLPSTWSGGQVCFQRTAAIGSNGASVVFEVESADCMAMDAYCSSTSCSAGVGRVIELPDPAAVAGG